MHFDQRSALTGEARLRKLLSIREALDKGTYFVEAGELADALLQRAVFENQDLDSDEIATERKENRSPDFWN